MKTGNKILISVAIVALVGLVCFYFYFPIYLIGPIMPLHFSLYNYDDVNKHNIKIEIFDLNNKSIFNEIYNLGPNEEISSPEITKKKGEYTFNVILDDKITKTARMTNVLERFPYWKTSDQHKREVQRELYKVLVSREERRRVGDWLKTEKSIEDHEPLKLNLQFFTVIVSKIMAALKG